MTSRQYKWALLVLAVVLLAGCGGGGGGQALTIPGTWDLYAVSWSLNGAKTSSDQAGVHMTLILYANGNVWALASLPSGGYTDTGTWQRVGNDVVISWSTQGGDILHIQGTNLYGVTTDNVGNPLWLWFQKV